MFSHCFAHQSQNDFGIVADLAEVAQVGIARAWDAIPSFQHLLWFLNIARVEVHQFLPFGRCGGGRFDSVGVSVCMCARAALPSHSDMVRP